MDGVQEAPRFDQMLLLGSLERDGFSRMALVLLRANWKSSSAGSS